MGIREKEKGRGGKDRVSSGMVAPKNRKNNRKLRIEKIGKIGKSLVLLSTKIASLHPITVITKATSPQILFSQDLDQLSPIRRGENDQFLGSVML